MSQQSFREGDLVEVISWGFKGRVVRKRKDKRHIDIYHVQSEVDGEVTLCRRQEMILRREVSKDGTTNMGRV